MRRSLIVTVAAAVGMVLLAMLVPMAVLLRSYALEDRLASAALEVQATETVVSGRSGQGRGSVYVDAVNRGRRIQTTVLYPDGDRDRARPPARTTGWRRPAAPARPGSTTSTGGAEILVPVSLGGSSAAPSRPR